MSLLLDENLSPRLVARLLSLFSGLIHVRDVGLKQASDEQIWTWAQGERLLGGYRGRGFRGTLPIFMLVPAYVSGRGRCYVAAGSASDFAPWCAEEG